MQSTCTTELSINKYDENNHTMKNYICAILFLSILHLFSCNSPENNSNKNTNNSLNNDSLASENRAIEAFNKSVVACQDSINKYNLVAINDTCLKYIYVIYGTKQLKKYDSLTIAVCSIKLTDFKKISDKIYKLHYTLFIKDTVPIVADLAEGAMIHTFEYDKVKQKIIKGYLGQHSSFIDEKELSKLYHSHLVQ